MNTLNNIHALIDVDSEKAKETVIELSKLMRFLLYESGQRVIPLAKEVTFLSNFVELMKLRYTENIDIQMELPESIPSSIQVPPLLLLPFLENAFKHGISYRKPSYVHFSLSINESKLCCIVKNSNHSRGDNQKVGIGLDNVRKRLQILFGSSYQLNVSSTDEEFRVDLTLDLAGSNVNF
ncbi:histidine kinase [uncultured Acetobacteroides sp.]|uniref:sensor histidine kinase n=1 Tax=uncultured Acetobacteroides sp. TaxID=1760811 RepID=UPI0029F536A9|nr:histidine kinase [uncultured Acetobacteroides sp.]